MGALQVAGPQGSLQKRLFKLSLEWSEEEKHWRPRKNWQG